MSPGIYSFESLSQELKLEAEARATALEEEAAKHQEHTFYFCGKIAHTDWRHNLLDLRSVEYPLNDYRAGGAPIVQHGLGPGLHYGGPFSSGAITVVIMAAIAMESGVTRRPASAPILSRGKTKSLSTAWLQ